MSQSNALDKIGVFCVTPACRSLASAWLGRREEPTLQDLPRGWVKTADGFMCPNCDELLRQNRERSKEYESRRQLRLALFTKRNDPK